MGAEGRGRDGWMGKMDGKLATSFAPAPSLYCGDVEL